MGSSMLTMWPSLTLIALIMAASVVDLPIPWPQ